jgi:hypothetical protein
MALESAIGILAEALILALLVRLLFLVFTAKLIWALIIVLFFFYAMAFSGNPCWP